MSTSSKPGASSAGNSVRIPMMPKGVEHSMLLVKKKSKSTVVRIPMMPKGVEHTATAHIKTNTVMSENSDDAERR